MSVSERRASARASQPTRKVLDNTQAVEAARLQHKARETASLADRVPFQTRGEQHASALQRGEEPVEVDSGSSSEDEEEEEPEAVAQQQQRGRRSGPPREKKPRVARKGKWTPVAKGMLANQGLLHQVWKVNGGPKTLGEKWDELYQSLQMPPYDAVFGGMKKSAMKTQLEKMVNNCSSEGTQAQRESGGGTDGTEEESDETEEERKVAADLEKTLQAIVDAKAAAAQESKAKKQQALEKTATNTMYGLQAVSQGNVRCGPGARATSFGAAREADDLAFVGLAGGGGGAGGGSGRSCPTMSSSSGRSSPAVDRVAVPPLGSHLATYLDASTIPEIERNTDATAEQADLFLNKGFTYDQLNRKLAVELLYGVFDRYHSSNVMEWVTIESMVEAWGSGSLEDDEGLDDFEVPGISTEAYFKILGHFGVPSGHGGPTRELYVGGWPESQDPTTAKFEHEARMLAEDCLPGRALAAAEGAAAEGTGTPASSNGGPSRQAPSQGRGNRGRKTRKSKNKAAEDGLDGFMEKTMNDARQMQVDQQTERRAEADKKEAGKRSFQAAQFQHDADQRKVEQARIEARDDKHRAEDKAERQEVRTTAATAAAARKVELRAEEDRRAHEIAMMKLQVQLAKESNRPN